MRDESFLLITMNSHVSNCTWKRSQIKAPTKEGQRRAQVAYRHPLPNEEIRRVSEQTSPQVARAAGHPGRETSADLTQAVVQSAVFSFGVWPQLMSEAGPSGTQI
jgi:hypothetical protein